MKIALISRESGRPAGFRDVHGYGVLILMALVASADQVWPQTMESARQANQQVAQFAQNQESQPQTKTEQGSTPKISMDVKTVSVPVTVRDKHGKIISNLAKEDFAVEEDGRPQTVNYFARENDLP
jgi:hypothetical protein